MKRIDNVDIISTKKGDTGFSKNFSNESIPKTDILFDTIGAIDELTSFLGITYHYVKEKDVIKRVQRDLQTLMSVIATNVDSKQYQNIQKLTKKDIEYLEFMEQHFIKDTAIEPKFVLPGSDSTLDSSYLDYARSITRRVERLVNQFAVVKERMDLDLIKTYLNRLSDLLYILARTYDKQD
jgi:cob(I)alamin adenosyltransferase